MAAEEAVSVQAALAMAYITQPLERDVVREQQKVVVSQ